MPLHPESQQLIKEVENLSGRMVHVTEYPELKVMSTITAARGPAARHSVVPGYEERGQEKILDKHPFGPGLRSRVRQLKKVTHQDGAYTSYEYDLHGRITAQTGSADYPVRYTYHATDGWMTEMKTYRDTTGDDALNGTAGNASLTTWGYDGATGLLTSKTDAANKATSYTYWTGTTLLKERLWARFVTGTTRVTTTYNYDAAGQLTGTTYNDGTPSVTRTYDRAGREAMRSDGVGDTTFSRTAAGFVTSEAGDADILYGWTLNRTVDAYGRYSGVDGVWSYAGISANNGIVTAAYAYNSATGRLDSVTNNSRPVALTYTANSDQPAKRQFKDNASNVIFEQEYGYDEAGRLSTALTRDVSPATVHAAYYYQYDNRNRRTAAVREDGIQWNYVYDKRGQVTSAKMKTGADYLAGRQYEYAYDAIGNRLTAKSGGDTAGDNLRTITYTTNNLNQYAAAPGNSTAISNPLTFDVNGLATNTATDTNAITVAIGTGTYESPDAIQPGTNGVTARWHRQKTATSAVNSKPTWETVNVKENGTLKSNGPMRLPPVNQAPTYDHDGNLLTDGTWTYTWDAENRLLAAEQAALPQGTGAPSARLRITFIYDGLGRRIYKTTDSNGGGGWTTLSTKIWVYDGWNVILRANVGGGAVTWEQAYIWGPDMSGTWQGAGGVGGLLVENKNLGSNQVARRLVGYDGNGNVTTLADGTNGNLWALYEYDAFGNETRHHNAVGSHADDNPFRFSTKPLDDETGLVYYGYRYYSGGLGRWISRDPAFESGGLNLMSGLQNDALNSTDLLGQWISIRDIKKVLVAAGVQVPSAPAAGAPSGINVTVTSKPGGRQVKDCGYFLLGVNFSLNTPSQKGGMLVQKVTRERYVEFCTGREDESKRLDDTFWETWYIHPGETTPVSAQKAGGVTSE